MIKRVLAATATFLLFSSTAAFAESAGFNQAAAEYKAGNYQKALSSFKELHSQYPDNELVRYYLALCHQSIGHVSQAKEEYQWLIKNGRTNLKDQAQKGLNQLEGIKTHLGEKTPRPSKGPQAVTQSMVKAARVIDFYADWCGPCKTFSPVFESTSRMPEFRGLKFDKLNIDDEQNKSLVQKFNVQSIPTMVILDANNKALYNSSPPRDKESLAQLIRRYR